MCTALLEQCCIVPWAHSDIPVLAHCYKLDLAHVGKLDVGLSYRLHPRLFLVPVGIVDWELIGILVLERIRMTVLEYFDTPL